jgi:hypothetical protein
VSNLSKYRDVINNPQLLDVMRQRRKKEKGKPPVPGHVLASLHWNKMCEINADKFSLRITDGSRIVVCKLKPNRMKIDSIAYPMDEPHLPPWFRELPFDNKAMEEVIIDKKISNVISVLGWKLDDTRPACGEEFFIFA